MGEKYPLGTEIEVYYNPRLPNKIVYQTHLSDNWKNLSKSASIVLIIGTIAFIFELITIIGKGTNFGLYIKDVISDSDASSGYSPPQHFKTGSQPLSAPKNYQENFQSSPVIAQTPTNSTFCSKCGSIIKPKDRKCSSCGSSV